MTNCTFSGNSATNNGGGMYNASSSPTVTNCIFWENSDSGGMDESAQIHTDSGTPTVNFSDVQGGWTGAGGNNINADPNFADADGPDNTVGTLDDNLRLLVISPCIDAGDNSVVTESTDLDGNTRISHLTVDMGAYEFQDADGDGIPDESDTKTVHNITQVTDHFTLQLAIDAAINGDVIEAGPGTYFEAINFLGKAITVRSASGDPNDTIIDGGAAGSVVNCSNGETATTVLDGFTITNGSATNGGGMFNNGASPTVTNCTFSGNSATFGGGMSNTGNSSPTVTNCTFVGNTARGGGMYNLTSSPTVTNCTFSGNTADFGGGMFNVNSSSPTVTNCTFSGNTATNEGGGMWNKTGSSPTVMNCTFSGNSATTNGGGMFNTN
ncbi:MAG: right-handed parallel beta-helix repeat-containing protein, partial [Planctomycetes bacterium]|nr:right-handed parallel beta-helix repeat-containing protein [Planctomycetota bacterium]